MEPMRMKLLLQKLKFAANEMKAGIYTHLCDLDCEYATSDEPVPYAERLTLEYRPIKVGEIWSKTLFECAWFHITGDVPTGYSSEELYLGIDIDGEACIFSDEGEPRRGLTNVSSEFDRTLGMPGKRYVPFADGSFRTDRIDLWLDAGHNDLFGEVRTGKILQMGIYRCNNALRDLFYDYQFLRSVAEALDERDPVKMAIYYALENVAVNISAWSDGETIFDMRERLRPYLERKGPAEPSLTFHSVGHAHLDLAWLWPVRESKRKAGRTFSTALANIDKYDGYIFGASQPQQYEWVKECYPALYARIKDAVASGRIEPQGAMWVEPDTNVTGAESLVRQIYYGKSFWREEFGREVDILWIPDVFGFTGALPQIMKGCGAPNLLTIKISWNKVNKFPYHSFRWQGIDGSEVLVHMPPEGTYNSSGAPEAVMRAAGEYSERGISKHAMMLYGIGDGGGGPNREHLEFIRREGDVCGLPRVINSTSEIFFGKLREEYGKLPTYKGEMYLECHQGTYSSQAKNKLYNRRIEEKLALTELLLSKSGEKYPKEKLDPIWKEVLLYQFHDILPGSSISCVYKETTERYGQMLEELDSLCAALMPAGDRLCAFNPTPYERCEYVNVDGEWYKCDVKPFAASELVRADGDFSVRADNGVIENSLVLARFDDSGALVSLYDKRCKRESIVRGNLLNVYEDSFDAWDTYVGYVNSDSKRFELVSAEPYVMGAEAGIRFEYSYGASRLWQKVYLTEESAVLKFETRVDWQETKKMLRAEFTPDVYTDEVTCDIQFGSIKRPATDSNSHEWAKYEICAHKWVDMSERSFGLSLLNNCKYGHRVKGGVMSLCLLRSQNYPCVDQDKGMQEFTYALLPHASDAYSGETAREGYALNKPLVIARTAPCCSIVATDNIHAVIETVKPAYDGDGIVIRVYNDTPDRINASFIGSFASVCECNMLEENSRECDADFVMRPFEIKTFRLKK